MYQGCTASRYPICTPSEIGSCEVVAYRWLKTIENFKTSTSKVVAVANERWSLTLQMCSK